MFVVLIVLQTIVLEKSVSMASIVQQLIFIKNPQSNPNLHKILLTTHEKIFLKKKYKIIGFTAFQILFLKKSTIMGPQSFFNPGLWILKFFIKYS